METKIIRGDPVRDRILAEVKAEVEQLKEEYHGEPGIAFIGFGGVPLAKYNVPMHIQLATAAGLRVTSRIMDVDAGEEDLLEIIRAWNADDSIHAIVLLQPLPPHLNPVRISDVEAAQETVLEAVRREEGLYVAEQAGKNNEATV